MISCLLSSGYSKKQIKSMTVEELENAYVEAISIVLGSATDDAV